MNIIIIYLSLKMCIPFYIFCVVIIDSNKINGSITFVNQTVSADSDSTKYL